MTFTRTNKLGDKLGVKLGVKLGENEIIILKLMEDNKYITTKELSEHIKIREDKKGQVSTFDITFLFVLLYISYVKC
ncbi:hypothetical protein ES708_06712 [subsurface metagenome]